MTFRSGCPRTRSASRRPCRRLTTRPSDRAPALLPTGSGRGRLGVAAQTERRSPGVNRDEHRAILGDEILAHIDALAEEAPEPSPEVVEKLRRIMTHPGGAIPERKPCRTECSPGESRT